MVDRKLFQAPPSARNFIADRLKAVWVIAVHLAVACDVFDGVFSCCPCLELD